MNLQTSLARWSWSHSGRVLTIVSGDTLVLIDVVTGSRLREYYGAPWLKKLSPSVEIQCLVAHVDGSLVVSLPGGCVTTFPGVTPPLVSSIADPSRSLRPLQIQGSRIADAIPQSRVAVHSLLGAVVMEGVIDESGAWDFDGKGLPHGAYVVVYSTIHGVQSGRLLR